MRSVSGSADATAHHDGDDAIVTTLIHAPRQQAIGRESMEALETAMGSLSEEHREILMLRFADGLSYEEIAQTLEMSLGTVKSRINRARGELKEKMKEFL